MDRRHHGLGRPARSRRAPGPRWCGLSGRIGHSSRAPLPHQTKRHLANSDHQPHITIADQVAASCKSSLRRAICRTGRTVGCRDFSTTSVPLAVRGSRSCWARPWQHDARRLAQHLAEADAAARAASVRRQSWIVNELPRSGRWDVSLSGARPARPGSGRGFEIVLLRLLRLLRFLLRRRDIFPPANRVRLQPGCGVCGERDGCQHDGDSQDEVKRISFSPVGSRLWLRIEDCGKPKKAAGNFGVSDGRAQPHLYAHRR